MEFRAVKKSHQCGGSCAICCVVLLFHTKRCSENSHHRCMDLFFFRISICVVTVIPKVQSSLAPHAPLAKSPSSVIANEHVSHKCAGFRSLAAD